uniref:C3H1-type domain-containing protein n=1 Tax=Hyaloperonospora arabidopsidis (strain Emoy2) TaxID=559515 RepID=M4BWC1_HYAAE
MIRAEKGILDLAAVRQINRDVHLGDLITANGTLQRKLHELGNLDGWMLILHSMRVDELWSLRHADTVFSYTDSSGVSSPDSAAVNGSWALPPSSKAEAINKYTNMVVIDGFNACKFYFSSSGGANCLRGEVCHFWHGQPEHFAENRRRWMKKRLEQRAKAAHLAGDTIDPHSKIDKAQRSRIFCDWLVSSVGKEQLAGGTGVIDIAGGKGDIPTQLWIQRGIPTTLIDPVRSDGPIEKVENTMVAHCAVHAADSESIDVRML